MWWRSYSQTLLYKYKIEHISGSAVWNVIKFVFIACLSRDLRKYMKTKVLILAFAWYKAFLKSDKESGSSLSVSFSSWFLKKNISHYISLTDQISLPDCLYFSRYWVICGLQLFVNQVVTSQNLKLTLLFNLT